MYTPSGRSAEAKALVLTSRGDGPDARGAHDIDPGVALLSEGGFAGVESNPDAHRPSAEPYGPRYCSVCSRKRIEESVSLCVDLPAFVRAEAVAQDPPVVCQHRCEVVTELLQELRASLYVAEEERHGPTGQRWHGAQGSARNTQDTAGCRSAQGLVSSS